MINCQNSNIRLVYDENSSEIISVLHNEKEYIFGRISVLTLCLRDKDGEKIIYTSADMSLISYEKCSTAFSAIYRNELVEVILGSKITSHIEWSLNVKVTDEYVVEWANYPCFTVENNLSEDEKGHKILWGFNEGVLITNIEDREKTFSYMEPEYPSKGLMGVYPAVVETQFMAYFNCDDGLYFGAHDREDHFKGVDFYRHDNGGIFFQLRHYSGVDFGQEFSISYPVVVDFFKGDWDDACEIYRNWFEEENKFIPISKNETLPEWYHKSPIVITYPVRGVHDTDEGMPENKMFPYCNVLPHVDRLEKELQSPIMVLLMHWEGTAPWAPPIVWPPYGGEEALKELIDELHKRGDVLGVYCSGIGWTLRSNVTDYDTEDRFNNEQLEREMCVSPTQSLQYSNICTSQRVGYDLCPSRDFTVNIIKEQVSFMADAGIDYIQLLDQNHGGTPYFCYSRSHGHPPVPGKWQVDAMKHLLNEVKNVAPNTLFGCESAAAESYIPYLQFSDNRYNLNYNLGEQVPVYAYIYHPYVNNFMGNQVCVNNALQYEKSPETILERIAYSFSAGDMLTLVLDQNGDIQWNWGIKDFSNLPDQEEVKEFVRNLNYWRKNKPEYLHTGTMIKPFSISCGKNILHRKYVDDSVRNKIYSRAWNSEDGKIGQFLINYNNEATSCTILLPRERFTLTDQNGASQIIEGGETEILINKLSAVLLERE